MRDSELLRDEFEERVAAALAREADRFVVREHEWRPGPEVRGAAAGRRRAFGLRLGFGSGFGSGFGRGFGLGFGRLVAAMAVILSLAIGGGFVALLSGRRAPARSPNAFEKSVAVARAAALQNLEAVTLPAAAVRVSSDPERSLRLGDGDFLGRLMNVTGAPELVDVHRFWRVPASPRSVLRFIDSHVPAGAGPSGTGSGNDGDGRIGWYRSDSVVVSSRLLASEGIQIGVTAARGGGTAVRVDGYAYTKAAPPGDLPSAVSAAVVYIDRGRGGAFRLGTITSFAADPFVGLFNALHRAPSGGGRCAAGSSAGARLLDVRFTAGGRRVLARAMEDGCGRLDVTIGGHAQPPRAESIRLPAGLGGETVGLPTYMAIWSSGALTVCDSRELRAAVAPASVTGSGVARSVPVRVNVEDVSRRACMMPGDPGVALRGAGGHVLASLHATVGALLAHHQDDPALLSPVFLTPGDAATITFTWARRAGCTNPAGARTAAPASVAITTSSARRAVSAPIPSGAIPAVCGGQITVGPGVPLVRRAGLRAAPEGH
jgi:hypothetical protein